MRTTMLLVAVVLGSLAVDEPSDKAPEGFTPLFNGEDLSGWKLVNTEGNFRVRDGVLVQDRGRGWLATEKTFGDFTLRLRYRFVTPGADGGIFIRAGLEGKNWPSQGYQVQNMDNRTLGMVMRAQGGTHDAEAVERLKKPAGEWQTLQITAKGSAVRVSLNGEEVASYDEALARPEGHIGIQAEGGVLEFARIDLRPLGADAEGR